MASINEILGKNIDSVKALRAEIKSLQDSLVGLDSESQAFKDTSAKLSAAQDELTKVTRAGKEENVAAKDSIVGMQQEYKKLYDQYKLLSDEQRNSDFGKNMAESLEALSNKLNTTKQGVGNFKDNIGRYAQSITDAFSQMGVSVGGLQGPLKLANGGFKTLNATMKANPVGLIAAAIAGLIAIFKKMKDAVGQNEELQMRYNEAMAKFQPIIDAAKNSLNNLAEGFVGFVEFVGKAVQKIREFGASITDFLGITKGAKKELQDQTKLYSDLAKATNELTKNKREYQKLNATDQANLDNLRSEAAATEDLTAKQKMLEEAKLLQEEINNRNIEIAKQELEILETQATLTANDAAMNDKLAAAVARVSQAEAEGARKMKELNSELKSTKSGLSSAAGAAKNYREEARKLYDELVQNSKTEIQKLDEKYKEEKKLLVKYHLDTTLLDKKYYKERMDLMVSNANKILSKRREAFKEQVEQEVRHREATKTIGDEVAYLNEMLGNLNGVTTLFNNNIQFFKENDADNLANLFQRLFNEADWSKMADFEYVTKLLPEFAQTLENIGAETWVKLTGPIDDLLSRIQTLYGVTVKTRQDLVDQLNLIPVKMKEALDTVDQTMGEGAAQRIAETIREVNMALVDSEIGTIQDGGDLTTKIAENNFIALAMQRDALEQELADFKGTRDQKLELMQQYYDVLAQMRENDLAAETLDMTRRRELIDASFESFDAYTNSLNNVLASWENVIQAEINGGKITQQEAKRKEQTMKRLEAVMLAVSVANIAAQTAQGIMSVWQGYAAELPVNAETAAATGPAAAATKAALDAKSLTTAILRTATLATQGGAQIAAAIGGYIAKAKASSSESGGGTATVGATPALIDSTPYSYTKTVQNTEEEDEFNQRPIYVTVTDIEEGLGHKAKVVNESSF